MLMADPMPRLILLAALALAGCGLADEPRPAPGAVERFTASLERDAAAEKAAAARGADARASARADKALRRIADSERERLARQ
jgi:hypothetical protein